MRHVLRDLGIEHWVEGQHHDTPDNFPPPKGRLSFTVSRDPETWLESWRWLVAKQEPNPHWAWPVQRFLMEAKTVEDAQKVMDRYAEGVDMVIPMEDIRNGLQRVFDACGLNYTVPDRPPVTDTRQVELAHVRRQELRKQGIKT